MALGSGIRDPGSGIRKKPITDPGSRGQKGTGSRIPDPDPQHCIPDTDPDSEFLTIPDPGVKKARIPNPGSGSETLVTKMQNMDSVLINTAFIWPNRKFRILCRFTGVLYTAITKAPHDCSIWYLVKGTMKVFLELVCHRHAWPQSRVPIHTLFSDILL